MSLTGILTIVATVLITVIIFLGFMYWYMSYKNKQEENNKNNIAKGENKKTGAYTKLSVLDFMQFDKIEDNMIVQDNGARYLMIVECEGINYDLMSEMEKNSVELGFIQFLNTLRFPIQLYTQTRTINIENNIIQYRERLKLIKQDLDKKQRENNYIMQNPDEFTEKQKQDTKMELLRLQNLYDYGADVITNIEKTSQNKNVLKKSYYVIVPYYKEEIGGDILNEEEKRNMIFAELYTRAQAIVRTLFMASVKSRILNSVELADLIYVAINRDESEVYGINKALAAGYDELYSTSQDVLDKRMKALDKKIQEKALEKAQTAINEVKSAKQRRIEKKEENFETLVRQMAEKLLKENKQYIGIKTAEEAIEKLDENTKEKEEGTNEQKTKKRTRKTAAK